MEKQPIRETNYTLIRSNRKTMAIHITREALVEVRAPLKTVKSDIDRFVQSKRDWIDKHLALMENRCKEKSTFTLGYGDTVALQGCSFPIISKPGDRAGFDGKCFYLPPGLSSEEIKQAVIQIYRLTAKRLLTNKTVELAKQMNVTPSAVKINGAKTRWGSCSGKNSINYSWRLMMAEDEAIDYVVVHELAHLKELNHSSRFWAIVAGVLPDYKAREDKLKKLQKRLVCEDWD